MDSNRKAPQWRAMGPFREGRKDRADQSQNQYRHPSELIQDVQRFGRDLQHLRNATPEPRVCIPGIPESVPYSMGWR